MSTDKKYKVMRIGIYACERIDRIKEQHQLEGSPATIISHALKFYENMLTLKYNGSQSDKGRSASDTENVLAEAYENKEQEQA